MLRTKNNHAVISVDTQCERNRTVQKYLNMWGKRLLMVIGAITIISFTNDIFGTMVIRNHHNAISSLERDWDACSKMVETDVDLQQSPEADGFIRQACKEEAFERHQAEKDKLMAICSISQVGNFLTYSGSTGDEVSERPTYYDVPFYFIFYGACMDYIKGRATPVVL